jgi:hypothetical protein
LLNSGSAPICGEAVLAGISGKITVNTTKVVSTSIIIVTAGEAVAGSIYIEGDSYVSGYIKANNFKLLNSGVSLEDIIAMSAKKYSDISAGATTGLPPVNNATTINQDDSKTEINEINNKSEDNKVIVQFTNCRFERGTSADEIEKALMANWRNRTGKLQAVIRNNLDNKTSRHN